MDTSQAIKAFGALAQDTRLLAYRALVEAGPDGWPAGALAEHLGVPATTLSFHLSQLLQAGLVTQRRQSRQVIYAAQYETMNGLIAFLTENCCGRGTATGACAPAAPTASKERKRGHG